MGRFLQSGWPSILVSTSLNVGFLELYGNKEANAALGEKSELGRGKSGTAMLDQIHE